MLYDVIITAAGKGSRMHAEENKVFLLLEGKPILMYSLETFLRNKHIQNIFITLQLAEIKKFEQVLEEYNVDMSRITLVAGGETRQESVYEALKKVTAYEVLIHDGARPFILDKDIDKLVQALQFDKGAILGRMPVDTIKEINAVHEINRTLDRSKLIAAQTPQGFDTQLLIKANELAIEEEFVGTDDASIFEYGTTDYYVKVVEGSPYNIKVTYPQDLVFGKTILEQLRKEGEIL